MTGKQLAAIVAMLSALATLTTAVVAAVERFPRGLAVLACASLAVAAAGYGVIRRGLARTAGLALAGAALAVAGLLMVTARGLVYLIPIIAGAVIWYVAARAAFGVHAHRPAAPPPHRPVLFVNPWSGGGKAARFSLVDQARARGIESVELRPGDDLETLVHEAVARGADAVAVAGGDGSQAIVAAIAAELGLPYACVPAGTRNHFALDLGVNRDDVVGALDAFVDGGERQVDLGEVNGRVFVNNVSLGLYAVAVQRTGYRDAKLRTLLDTAPDVLGPGVEQSLGLRWTEPDGQEQQAGAAILVSNNRYRLGRVVGSGTRPRIDDGLLGVAVVTALTGGGPRMGLPKRPWREWSTQGFEVDADRPIPAGIDGEAVVLDPPVRFRIRRRVLRVRIARQHPGVSPSAMAPEGVWDTFRMLAGIAAGRNPSPRGG